MGRDHHRHHHYDSNHHHHHYDSKGRVRLTKRMNFRKSSKNLYFRFWTVIHGFKEGFSKKLQYNFPKMRGGGQRLFGIFPKIHLIW